MAEQLGEALLVLRTDDAGLEQGMRKAKAGADSVGTSFDRTKKQADQLTPALGRTGQAASGAGIKFTQAGQQVIASAGAQRAGMMQLGAQLGDMATMYSLGARPMQIFASQIGQVTGAIQLAAGGASKFATFLSGPWGIALTVATIVLVPLIGKLFETADAMEKVELASSKMSDAQSILGSVMDLTTGKMKDQTAAAIALARAQAVLAQIQARKDQADARREMIDIRKGKVELQGGMGGGLRFVRTGDASSDVVSAFQDGSLRVDEAERSLNSLRKTGIITEDAYARASAAVTKFGQATVDEKMFGDVEKALNGDTKALQQFLNLAQKKTPHERAGPKPPKDRTAEIADRQAGEIARLEQEELQAKLAITTDANDRAAIQGDLLQLERNERVRQIEADKDLSRAQKDAQLAYIDRLYGKSIKNDDGSITVESGASPLGQAISRELREREVQLANDALARQASALDAQASITTKLEERDGLERRSLELQQQIEDNLLEQDIANGRIADADAARALLAERQAAQREALLRSQMGPMDRYRLQVRSTVENMGQEIEQVQVDGIQGLIDGIAEAGFNFEKLGQTAKRVLAQILADLIRLQLTKALFSIIGGGMGGGIGGGVSSSLGAGASAGGFAGMFATGGLIPAGQFGIVGENGPEPVIGTSRGAMVLPNRRIGEVTGQGDRTTNNYTINVPARTDPRRTMSSVARGAQVGQARATRKGIAAPAGRY